MQFADSCASYPAKSRSLMAAVTSSKAKAMIAKAMLFIFHLTPGQRARRCA